MRLDKVAEDGIFNGFIATFNEYVAGYDEVALPGSFKRTIDHHGGRVAVINRHVEGWIGMGLEAHEEERGVNWTAKLVLENQEARDSFNLMKLARELGRPAGLSMGFTPKDVDQNRGQFPQYPDTTTLLREVAWHEGSVLPPGFQAYPSANVGEVRSQMRSYISDLLTELGVKHTVPGPVQSTQDSRDDSQFLHSLRELEETLRTQVLDKLS